MMIKMVSSKSLEKPSAADKVYEIPRTCEGERL